MMAVSRRQPGGGVDRLRDMYQVAVPGAWRGEMGEECSQSEKAAPDYRMHRVSSYLHHEVRPSHRVPNTTSLEAPLVRLRCPLPSRIIIPRLQSQPCAIIPVGQVEKSSIVDRKSQLAGMPQQCPLMAPSWPPHGTFHLPGPCHPHRQCLHRDAGFVRA
ncbi:hypothetical protein B0T17DRAFT_404532 [Bombardia bombarda]|uniref:Uncharacterized protein n=1 Tax=Bombardia bombarda TaxID=252184 RepID=A0AA39WAP3_9PEZI|nr:hypothetical protein B0T17DRAFT_404532 [Bombardia bombarda]